MYQDRSLTATLKNAETSDKKMNLIAKMVRGMTVVQAIEYLQILPKKAGKILLKVIKSAAANAQHNAKKDLASLYVSTIQVWRWRKLKRMKFVGRARIHSYVKHRTNVKVELAVK